MAIAKRDALTIYLASIVLLVAVSALSAMLGSAQDLPWEMIRELRLPRILLAFGMGAGLAVSGAVLQAVFNNPLCEPYTLGISSGSALGAVIGVSLGLGASELGIAWVALLGALIFSALLTAISVSKKLNLTQVLLAGVMLSFFGSSCVALWMALADPQGVSGAVFWLMGDLSRATLQGALTVTLATLLITALILRLSRKLDALILGEFGARSVGVDPARVRWVLILLTSVIIGLCVSAGGIIGFVGLMVPHLLRIFGVRLHRSLIPLCVLWGGLSLIGADLIARVFGGGHEIPVGIVTAFVGAPLFVWGLLKSAGGPRSAL